MPPSPPPITPAAAKALEGLADIAVPPPVSWMPQTWGWAVLAVVLMTVAVWALWRLYRWRQANRYRAEALAALSQLAPLLDLPERRGEALAAIGAVWKQTALAAFPRSEVAPLSGTAWTSFLRQHAPGELGAPATALLDDREYRGPVAAGEISGADAAAVLASAQRWIRGHRVSA